MTISSYGRLAALALCFSMTTMVLGQVSSYYPDGSLALDYDYAACDNKTQYSASCYFGEGDQCLPNGLCYFPPQDGQHGNYIYRGACTDKSWTDPACPKLCVTETPNRYEALSYCPQTGDFCCVKAVKGGDCCSQQQKRFSMNVDVEIITKLKLGGNATVSASTNNAESDGNPSTAKKDKDSSLSAGAVAGITVAVVVLCAAFGYGCYRWWLYRRPGDQKTLSSSSDGDKSDFGLEVVQNTGEVHSAPRIATTPGLALLSSNDESLFTPTSDKARETNEKSGPQLSELPYRGDAEQIDGTPMYPPEMDGKSLRELSARRSTRSVQSST